MSQADLNPLEAIVVQDDLNKRGITSYQMRPGNNCIWVSHGFVNEYHIFKDGKLVDVVVD